jgi:hypothetical protein
MKTLPYTQIMAFVAAVLIVASSNGAPVDQPWPESANHGVGKDQMLLAQTDTSGPTKNEAGKKRPLVNVDKNGVILKGYDPVAYFKQSLPVKGKAKYASKYQS